MSGTKRSLEERVAEAALAALEDHKYVSSSDVLINIGWLTNSQVQDWRKGRIPYLEKVIQTNLNKISDGMKAFRQWARKQGLKPSETSYLARTKGPQRKLWFSKSGNPSIEEAYRTHYVSPELSQKKRENLQKRLSQAPELVVYQILRASKCSKCGTELFPGNLLLTEADSALCIKCAGIHELIYLPSGNAKLTRRAKGHSSRYAVVVRFSRTRKRYERQGILVERDALDRAEIECAVE